MFSTVRFCISLFLVAFPSNTVLSYGTSDTTVDDETKLYQFLFNEARYVKDIRPLKASEQMNVRVKIGITGIEDLDEAREMMTTTVILSQVWNDKRLSWNKTDFGGVDKITASADKVWSPDITLWNGAPQSSVTHHDDSVVVKDNGLVFDMPHFTISTHCPMDITDYPNDVQICKLILGSWLYTNDKMDIILIDKTYRNDSKEIDVEVSTEGASMPVYKHPAWQLVDNKANAKVHSVLYSCCDKPFDVIEVSLTFRRKRTNFRYQSSAPAALFALLVPFTFLIPTKSPQKVIFGLLLIVALTLMLLTLESSVPYHKSSVPKIVIFYFSSLLLATLSVILATVVASVADKGDRRKPLPGWVNSMFLGKRGLRRILCLESQSPIDVFYSSLLGRHLEDYYETTPPDETQPREARELDQINKTSNNYLKEIAKSTRVTAGKMIDQDDYAKIRNEWEYLARVLDRLFFVIHFVMFLFTCVVFLT